MALSSRSLITKTGISTTQVFDMGGINISGGDFNLGSNIKLGNASGIITATSFSGSGANLTGIDLSAVTGATGDFSIADKIVHTGDTNTAIRFPAADTITAETAGSERLRIDSAGRLLLNTTTTYVSNQIMIVKGASPSAGGNRPYDGQLAIEGSETTGAINTGGVLAFIGHSGSGSRGFGSIRCLKEDGTSGNYGSYMSFETRTNGSAPAERLRIDSDGRILKGTSSSVYDVDIVGTERTVEIGVENNSSAYRVALNTTNNVNADFNIQHKTNLTSIGTGVNVPLCFHINGGTNAVSAEKMRLEGSGNLVLKGGNIEAGDDSFPLNFLDSISNYIGVAADGGSNNGDALFIAHSHGSGLAVFGYEAGGDRLVIGTDTGNGANKIDFITDFGGTSGGNTDNLNGKVPKLRIDVNGHLLHGVLTDEDTSGSGGLRFINSGDIVLDGDQKALVFRSTNSTAQLQSGIEWWNENGAGVQAKIVCDRTAVSNAPSDLVFYTTTNVDTSANNSEGDITERLRIKSDGKIGIGDGRGAYPIDMQSTSSPLTLNLKLNKNSTTNDYAEIAFQLWSGAGTGENSFGGSGQSRPSVVLRGVNESGSSAAGALVIGTFTGGSNNNTLQERVRVNSLGDLLINQVTNDTRLGIKARSSAVEFITCRNTSSTLKMYVHSSGNLYNTNGNYSQISDQSLKENIVDAKSQWNDIKNIKIRNFNFTEASGLDTHTQIGCVAQEVETVSPKLVSAPKDGVKTVANSVLYMKAVKALQEAMTRIETLESEVAALKSS